MTVARAVMLLIAMAAYAVAVATWWIALIVAAVALAVVAILVLDFGRPPSDW